MINQYSAWNATKATSRQVETAIVQLSNRPIVPFRLRTGATKLRRMRLPHFFWATFGFGFGFSFGCRIWQINARWQLCVVVVLLLVVAVVFYCSCCCCCCCHWAMLSIIDDAALAFEFLFLPLFLLTAFFLALAMEVSWSHWLHTILHISRLYTGLYKTLIHTHTIVFVLCALQRISTCLIASATVYIHALWLMIAKSDSWTDTRTVVNYIVWTFNSIRLMKPTSKYWLYRISSSMSALN